MLVSDILAEALDLANTTSDNITAAQQLRCFQRSIEEITGEAYKQQEATTAITLVLNQVEYALPASLYSIIDVEYAPPTAGTTFYRLTQVRSDYKENFEPTASMPAYYYMIMDDTTTSPFKLGLLPKPDATAITGTLRVRYAFVHQNYASGNTIALPDFYRLPLLYKTAFWMAQLDRNQELGQMLDGMYEKIHQKFLPKFLKWRGQTNSNPAVKAPEQGDAAQSYVYSIIFS